MVKPRRRSNSFADHGKNTKSKFEAVEEDPMFDEHIHGASAITIAEEDTEDVDGLELDKSSTGSSSESVKEGVEGSHGRE